MTYFSRRDVRTAAVAGAAALVDARSVVAQPGPAPRPHVKPVPASLFIDHGINQETRLETLRGYLPLTAARAPGDRLRRMRRQRPRVFQEFLGKVASGTQWRLGAIGVSEWTGVPLGAVLEMARVKPGTPRDALNVLVEGLDSVKVNRPISLDKPCACGPSRAPWPCRGAGRCPPVATSCVASRGHRSGGSFAST
jgi:hypothetical protein